MKAKAGNRELYGKETDEKFPEAFLYSRKAWDAYMGELWRSLLQFMEIGAGDTVIEVAPGGSTKIAMALGGMGFQGHLYVVDPAADALAQSRDVYRELMPKARITWVETSLAQGLGELPRRPACMLSNHPLDDMILAAGMSSDRINELFRWSCIDEETFFPLIKKTWDEIDAQPQRITDIKKSVFDEWANAIETLKPCWIAISQYNSSALQQSGMAALNQHAHDVLTALRGRYSAMVQDRLQQVFNGHKHYNNPHIGGEVLNAANWLVSKRP